MFSSLLGMFGCGGGSTQAAAWTRSRVLAKFDNVHGIAAAGGAVYAGNFDYKSRRGTIWRVPAAGGEPRLLVDDAGAVDQIRVYGEHLYWTGDGALLRVGLSGGKPVTIARGAVPALDFIIAEGRLCFAAGIPLGGRYYVYTVPLAGGPATKQFESTGALSHPIPAGDSIFWMTPGGLTRMRLDSGKPELIHPAEGARITSELTRDADALYFFQTGAPRSKHRIVRYPIGGGPPTVLAAPAAQTSHELLADGNHVYYFATPNSLGPYELQRVPKTGGDPAALDSGYSSGQLASDANSVFLLTIKEVVAVPKRTA